MTWLAELEQRAGEKLEWYVCDYYAASAGSRVDYERALGEWERVSFRPRAFRGPVSLDLSATMLGQRVASPILVAPMAQQVAADPRGELATAEAVLAAGTLMGVSINTAVRFDRIGATGVPWWFQLYLFGERSTTRSVVERAVAHGASAIILTVDTTALTASRPGMEPTEWPDVPGRARLANITADEYEADRRHTRSTRPTVADIGWLAEMSGLPVVVKGVLRADDAVAAADGGAAGIIVSTHGGRRMDRSVTSLRALPEVVAAVGDRCEVYVDSGIRSGAHVLTALSLGARAVFVGRPVMWGLVDGGADGVSAVLGTLTDELVRAIDQSGATGLADLGPDLVAF